METGEANVTKVVYTNRPAPYGDIITVRRDYEPPGDG